MRSLFLLLLGLVASAETLPPLTGDAPVEFASMWAGFDPRAEPLKVEVLKEWEQDGVVLQVLRYHIGTFKGKPARMAAVWGYPKDAKGLPGLVQIHGGGQYAHHRAVFTNAKRGYATISIAWAGRLDAPGYSVNPDIVKLFWEGKTDDPKYRLTTDWGALDAYHAPSRHKGTIFPGLKPFAWTLDSIDSPRNSPWFLCALGARRALTFLEQQPQVDPQRLGVYGHSMGGKLTVMTTAADKRVRAAAPSCGGISDRKNDSPLFRATVGDDAHLPHITCPIIFLSPANDFHGHINDLPKAVAEIATDDWRVTCAAHHNHQDTAEYEVATQLWFDEHLQKRFTWPATPTTTLKLETSVGVPFFTVIPDGSRPIQQVDIFYTQQGQDTGDKSLRENRINRYWHRAEPVQRGDKWHAHIHVFSTDLPLWVYANVRYGLDKPVAGAGYYYGDYETKVFNLSSLLDMVSADQLQAASVKPTLKPSRLIEDFSEGWRKDWFSHRGKDWQRHTHKIYHPMWVAPEGAALVLQLATTQPNTLIIGIDDHVVERKLTAGEHTLRLSPADFRNADDQPLTNWSGIKELHLADVEHIGRGATRRRIGAPWKGRAPELRKLFWSQ